MKKITLQLLLVLAFGLTSNSFAQKTQITNKTFNQNLTGANLKSIEETGIIRCATEEYEAYLQEKYPKRASTEEFEAWLAPKVTEVKQAMANRSTQRVLQTIPVIFHIITDGTGSDNVSQAFVQAQLDQLNIDYGNLAGSTYAAAADTEIQFCLAQADQDGAQLDEIGINRITDFGDQTFMDTFVEGTIKPATSWDPTQYMNIWVVGGLTDGANSLLGYAQFPSNSGLSGLNTNGGAANTDGVVIISGAVGSVANPNPAGGQYGSGRTLTHEVGHWLGLRHIWGDNWGQGQPNNASCGVDDFCADTPNAGRPWFGCPTGSNSCFETPAINDMVENYMDYTDDTCMHTFTANQAARITAVMNNSPRRMELASSTKCLPGMTFDLDGKIEIENLNLANCSDFSIAPEVRITNNGNNILTSATISYSVDGGSNTNINWTGSLALDQSETITIPLISLALGAHTFNVSLNNVNGGTDEQPSNNTDTSSFTITGSVCSSVGNSTDNYLTSTTGVVFNTINNLNNNPGGDVGYSDFMNLSTDINRESTYDLSVYYNPDGNYQTITYVWIDWNQNCSFDDPGEQYDLGTNPGSTTSTNLLSANSPLAIMVPNSAELGSTIMRVTTKYTDPGANQFPTSCENNHDAEVEDYTINVLASLSVDEFELDGISLYPNPTSTSLIIKLGNPSDLPTSYEIYNVLGQSISKRAISSEADLTINSSTLSNGMYFIKISKSNASTTLRFIKQ